MFSTVFIRYSLSNIQVLSAFVPSSCNLKISALANSHATSFPCRSCSTTNAKSSSTPNRQIARRFKYPVDWLPFKWDWRPQKNWFADSWDHVQTLEYDPSWPKPDFELSEELKTAGEDIKFIFSLASGSKADIKEVIKRNMLKKVQRHPNDTKSMEVEIALRTLQVRSLFDHAQKLGKKEIRGSRRMLHNIILKRNSFINRLYKADAERCEWVLKEFQLYHEHQQLGGIREMYTKKWDLRRLTKEYCENMVIEKKEAYHQELKQQQAEFLKEKEEILAWIEKEEKELEKLEIQ